jgi:hypothetical protein
MSDLTEDARRILADYATHDGVLLLGVVLAPLNPAPNPNRPQHGGVTLVKSRWLDRQNDLVRTVGRLVDRGLLASAPVVTREDLDRHDRYVITNAGREALAAADGEENGDDPERRR